ncbi:MAG: DUF2235 domain-containing protein [Pseudomonadota bacterium]
MKRLAFCFDGTWNDIEMGNPTNVAKTAQSIAHSDNDVRQVVYYDEGVGTGDFESQLSKIENVAAGMFGWGLRDNIIEAYTFLVINYEPGDEIYVFGFSRGAFTARSFVGLIRNVGIVDRRHLKNIREAIDLYTSREAGDHPDTDYCRRFRNERQQNACLERDLDWLDENFKGEDHRSKPLISVQYLGVWDTVGALGLPVPDFVEEKINREYGFHDTNLSTFVTNARHAVAADERRKTFRPTLWGNIDGLRRSYPGRYDEKIFPGTHGAVGGGGPIVGLSDAALEWVIRGAQEAGLAVDASDGSPLYRLQPNHRASLHNVAGKNDWDWRDGLMGVGLKDREFPNLNIEDIHESLIWRFNDDTMENELDGLYRPPPLSKIFDDIAARKPEFKADPSKEVFEGKINEQGELTAPKRVEKYKITAGDDLGRIARRFFDGNTEMGEVIFLHNARIGRLHNRDKMYVGRVIEIPYYM